MCGRRDRKQEANRRREQEQVIRNGKKIETGERDWEGGGMEL